jgi:hypothetical protein
MNPEGIGVQPMIANVTLSFKIIGGMGLKEPVDQLQNALSFNYYANTEIYDERATWTEDTSALDKMVVDAIVAKQPPVSVNNDAGVQQTNDAGQTIGEIKTTTPLPTSGETGEMSYMKIMDVLYDNSKTYFTNTYNSMDEIRAKTNYGMLSVVCSKRDFIKGTLNLGGVESGNVVTILGKPVYQENIDKLFNVVIDDINNGDNPILTALEDKGFDNQSSDTTLNIIKTNLVKYVKSLKGSISTDIGTIVNNKIGLSQQDFVQTIRKVSFVNSKTDGKILDDGSLKIYNLQSGAGFDDLVADYTIFKIQLNDYYSLLTSSEYDYKIIPDKIADDFTYPTNEDFKTVYNKRFYIVMARIFEDKNKVKDFIDKIITPNIKDVKKPKKLLNQFENIVEDLAGDYKDELKNELKSFEKFKKKSNYDKFINGLDEVLYKKGKPRIVNFTTEPDPTEQATKESNLKKLYQGDSETINNFETFDGKIKLN